MFFISFPVISIKPKSGDILHDTLTKKLTKYKSDLKSKFKVKDKPNF